MFHLRWGFNTRLVTDFAAVYAAVALNFISLAERPCLPKGFTSLDLLLCVRLPKPTSVRQLEEWKAFERHGNRPTLDGVSVNCRVA